MKIDFESKVPIKSCSKKNSEKSSIKTMN